MIKGKYLTQYFVLSLDWLRRTGTFFCFVLAGRIPASGDVSLSSWRKWQLISANTPPLGFTVLCLLKGGVHHGVNRASIA